jgi:hypothetical protein
MTSTTSSERSRGEQHATIMWLPPERERLQVSRIVHRTCEDVERDFHVRPDGVIKLAYGDRANEHDGTIPLAVHPSIPWVHVRVRVESFTPVPPHSAAAISVRWAPVRLTRFIPTLEADVHVLPAEQGQTELRLDGWYRPPFKLAGLLLDRLFGRFVAGFTAETFLNNLGAFFDGTRGLHNTGASL